ncbi:hypothetical protein [Qipengyuania marisflavi]|uniref:Uncharacterized protein n=1 Tax=Qipengyuania marisflavi TaxID=2486356 RepID=A0A5S3P5X8_9SPHN|nr:hypothetical protein [Qipengyuania marisflavi]TMM46158.1 hypothetical protein FEV51_12025 [Qipengyuania marisflavi]
MRLAIVICLSLAACTALEPLSVDAGTAALPTGATLQPSGHLSIGVTPPSAFPDDPPPMPTQLDSFARKTSLGSAADRDRAWQEVSLSPDTRAEFQRLRELLTREEAGNFIDVRLVHEPRLMGEFAFRRDGAATLARYTSDPQFRAVTINVDPAALERLREEWLERMQDGGPITSLSVITLEGRIELGVGAEEADFRRLAKRKGWDLSDPRLDFQFPPPQPEAFTDPRLASFVRAFAREDSAAGIRLTALGTGRIVLDDGCFRMADEAGKPQGNLVMFARGSQLTRDAQGYLAITGEEADALYRIGERGAWGGPNGVDEKSPAVRALRKACGSDEIINVAAPRSERLFALPFPLWVLDYAHTKDMTYQAAWREVIACLEKQEKQGRRGLDARDRCITQYNGWDYTGDVMPPPPGS